MKHILVTLLTAAAVSLPALAAETNTVHKTLEKKPAPDLSHLKPVPAAAVVVPAKATAKTIFYEHEANIESAYTVRTEDLVHFDESVTIGGNYYVTKGAGFHAAVALNDLNDQAIDLVEFGLIGRLPVAKTPLALTLGIGAEHRFVNDGEDTTKIAGNDWKNDGLKTTSFNDSWAVYAEGGVLFRVYEHFDLFAKVRGVRPIKGAEGEHIGIFIGADIPFALKF